MSEHSGPPRRAREATSAPTRRRTFLDSVFFPATVLTLILAAAAGVFAGSYTYALADPAPRRIPAAVVGPAEPSGKGEAFVEGMEDALGSSLQLREYLTYTQAVEAVERQHVFAILRLPPGGVELSVAGASGASVAELLAQEAPAVGRAVDLPVRVHDIKPLDKGDPRGLALFYISFACVIIGFVGAIQLSVNAFGLNPLERMAFTAAYSLLGGFTIAAVIDWLLNAVDLPFVQSWLILALTMFASGMVFTMFNTLIGRWAMIPTWGLMVLIGSPSSGGAVPWALLPSALSFIGRWLPPGASVNAQHTAVYFPAHQHLQPYVALGGWALVSCAVFWIWRHRHPGGRDPLTAAPS